MECLECGQTYSTDSMATAKQCNGCARIEALEAENAALRKALAKENFRVLALERSLMAASIFSQQTEGEG